MIFIKISLFFLLYLTQIAFAGCYRVRLSETSTADNIIINQLLTNQLESLGYDVERIEAKDATEAYRQLSEKVSDLYLTTWVPLDVSALKYYALNGKVRTLGEMVPLVHVGIAVNESAKELGMFSLGQLAKNADQLDATIYVEAQEDYVIKTLRNAIRYDLYGLSKFTVTTLTPEKLALMLQKAEENNVAIAFYTKQLSLNAERYATLFLYDTFGELENIQTQATIFSSARHDLPKNCPLLYSQIAKFNLVGANLQFILTSVATENISLERALQKFVEQQAVLRQY